MHNIAAMRRANGAQNAPQAPSQAKDPGDLSGFLDQIVQALQADPASATKDTSAKPPATPPTVKEVTEKVAEMLKKDGNLPAALQKLSKEELAEKISASLQIGTISTDATAIKPALTSDLVAQLSTQIQSAMNMPLGTDPNTVQNVADILQNNKGITIDQLAAMLNKIEPGSGDNKEELVKIVAQLQVPMQSIDQNAAINPAILQQLKDKIAQLLENGDKVSSEDIAQLKTDLVQTLQDQGVGPANIQNYLATLAVTLKNAKPDQTAAPQSLQAAAIADNLRQPIALPKSTAVAQDAAFSAEPLTDDDSAALALNITKNLLTQRPAITQAVAKDATAAQTTTATASTVMQQAAAPQPQNANQNVSAKVAGMGMSAEMFAALANGDSGFSDAGAQNQNNGQPGLAADTLGLLKPITVDAAHAKNFANFLSGAQSDAQNPVTQMVNIQLQRGINAKMDNTMTLHLTPAELGRLDIKLSFDKDGGVKAHMTVEKPETLAMLQKDSHHLQRTLQQSGLDVNDKSLSFDLRQQSQHQQNLEGFTGHQYSGHNADDNANSTLADNVIHAQMAVQSQGYITPSGVNIMV